MESESRRADISLFQRGLARSRTHAQELISTGLVTVLRNGSQIPITDASFKIFPSEKLVVKESELTQFVSRAGIKLEHALRKVSLDVTGLRCLDVGQSTGGFTDCLLQRGARSVFGIDVGRGQLDPKIQRDPRVTCKEEINAREMNWPEKAGALGHAFDLVVIDVSFISLTLILPTVLNNTLFNAGKVSLLALVKPQFEVGASGLDRNGVVKDPSLLPPVEARIIKCVQLLNWQIRDYFLSNLPGKEGNQEYFIYAEKEI